MDFLYVKALHIIFVVTWFAGLFYIVRLFIYYAEATEKPEPEKTILQRQFAIMQQRLWFGITWPSAVLTFFIGCYLIYLFWPVPVWLRYKLLLVVGLFAYHLLCHRLYLQQQKGIIKYTSNQLRIWNEVATLFLVGIVFLVVLKSMLSVLWGLAGLIVFAVLLMFAIRIYKKVRTGK